MSPFDKQLVIRKIDLIDKDLKKLKEIKPAGFDNYASDEDTKLKVERLLERIIGRVLDINMHIARTEYEVVPKDYKDSFQIIGRNEKIPEELIKAVGNSVGLRNIIAHEYEEIDNKKVYESIDLALVQIPRYIKILLKSLV